jgi:tetratricopeptide (TPR) repeat protein
VLAAEPEEPAHYGQLAEWMSALNMQKESRSALACSNALRQKTATDLALLPGWTDKLLAGVAHLQARRYAEARAAFEAVVLSHQDFPLAAWLLVRSAFLEGDYVAALSHGDKERTRWPACAPMLMCLAQASFAQGSDTRGVEYMHLASRADPAHEAAEKLFGPFNPYRSLWPAKLTLDLRLTVPPQVAIAAGLNRLSTSGRPRMDTEPMVPIAVEAPAAPGIPPAPLYIGEYIPVDAASGEDIALCRESSSAGRPARWR